MIAAGGAIASTIESKKARKSAEREADRQRQERLDAVNRAETEQQEVDITKNRKSVATRKRSIASARPRLRDTILTSPLGLQDEPETANKTILGR